MAEIKGKQEKQSIRFYQQIPFNSCDRWCARCSLTDSCQIFRQMFNDRLRHLFLGEDPDHPVAILADVKKAFSRIVKAIRDDVEKQGTDSRKIKIKIMKIGLTQSPRPGIFPLWRMGHGLVLKINVLLSSIFSEEEISEFLRRYKDGIEELTWYCVFFEGKLYQALAAEWSYNKEKDEVLRKFQKQEMDIAAELSFRALKSCRNILREISVHCPGYMRWSGDLSIFAGLILEKIETKFPACHQNRVIFHGRY